MTIGIAAISNAGSGAPTLFLASDRMLSAEGTEFESSFTKVISITSSIVVLVAGNVLHHTPVAQRVRQRISELILAEPNRWRSVEEVAELYRSEWLRVRNSAVESIALSPLGLTLGSLIERQPHFSYQFFSGLQQKIEYLTQAKDAEFEAIVAGVEGTEGDVVGHVYRLAGASLYCHDDLGYAAIGSGATHAISHFMMKGHRPNSSVEAAMFATYVAKRVAEAAPGVGREMDLVVIGPRLGSASVLRSDIFRVLESSFETRRLALSSAEAAAMNHLSGELEKVFTPPQDQLAPMTGADASPKGGAEGEGDFPADSTIGEPTNEESQQ